MDLLGPFNPPDNVICCQWRVVIGIPGPIPNPARKCPRQSIQQNIRVSLQSLKKKSFHSVFSLSSFLQFPCIFRILINIQFLYYLLLKANLVRNYSNFTFKVLNTYSLTACMYIFSPPFWLLSLATIRSLFGS